MLVPRKYRGMTETQAEFSAWLRSFDFDTFATFTTAKELSLPGCRRMAERFHRNHEFITMFWAAEPFSIRTGYHFHALINTKNEFGIPMYSRKDFWEHWTKEKQFGRSDFSPITKEFGENWTSEYITKYISKGLADYDIITYGKPTERPEYIAKYEQPKDEKTQYLTEERAKYLERVRLTWRNSRK